jgi:hypothetical protein
VTLAACGGGGSSGASVPAPTAAPPAGTASVKLVITIPAASTAPAAAKRRPAYISSNTQSAAIAVNGAAPVIVNLAAGSLNCKTSPGGGRSCTASISAPAGSDTFAEETYASTNATGPILSQAATSANIVVGQANVVALTLDGVVASVSLMLVDPTPPLGSTTVTGLVANFDDASGAAIIGPAPFVNPITISDSDTTGATVLSKSTLTSPGDAVGLSVTYNGNPIPPAVFAPSANGVPAQNLTSATLTPSSTQAFVDWPTYGYDPERSGYNPYTSGITPASLGNFKIAWQTSLNAAQSQPIIATNVPGHTDPELILGAYATVKALDAYTGATLWSTNLPTQYGQDCGTAGVSGTPVYDKTHNAIFVAAGDGQQPNHVVLYELNAGTGAKENAVTVTPTLLSGEAVISHAGLTLANGQVYVGVGSNCEGTRSGLPSWRGQVVAVDAATLAITNTFFTTWQQGGAYGGGGVWAWGGVSADTSGNVFTGTGNAETYGSVNQPINPPFVGTNDEQAGYAEHLVELNSNLSTVEGSNYPGFNFKIGYGDLDYTGTPVVYSPSITPGCGELTATQGKGGTLVINSAQGLGVIGNFALSVPSANAYYIGNPAYSPTTGYLYAAISSSGEGSSMLPPGLAAIGGCGSAMSWNTQFGPDSAQYPGENPRSAPTVTAGGVVFMGTPCTSDGNGGCGSPGAVQGALWAIDGKSPNVLNGGKPLLITGDNIRMAPSVDGLWIYLMDDSGNLYGLTVDPNVKGIAARPGRRITPSYRRHAEN